ncbi:hypothetical protein ACA910_016644 [Epithemia clementina (nom. ined.)]
MPVQGFLEVPLAQDENKPEKRYRRLTKWQGIKSWFRLPGCKGHFIPVDLSARYRRHLVWSKKDGDKLLLTVTARFHTSTLFLSLFVSTTLGVYFSPAEVVAEVRASLRNDILNLKFFAGIALNVSVIFTLAALISNVTAWSIFIVVSKQNAPAILRSSLGLYAAQLPNRLVLISFYLFFSWVSLFWFIIMPTSVAITLTIVGVLLMSHISGTYSAMGEVIMATSAMAPDPILSEEQEEKMVPRELYHALLHETQLAEKANIPINRQYRMNYKECIWELDE